MTADPPSSPTAPRLLPGPEWLEADGLGGYASGTPGARTRTYHALLMTAADPPVSRFVLVNGMEMWVETAAGVTALSTQCYAGADGAPVTFPDGDRHRVRFAAWPCPSWEWRLDDGTGLVLELMVAPAGIDEGRPETLLRWRRTAGSGPCTLAVRLLMSGRDHGTVHRENPAFRFDARADRDLSDTAVLVWEPYPGVPAIRVRGNGRYHPAPVWYRNFLYPVERDRGYADTEDLASPGLLAFDLAGDLGGSDGWLGLASGPADVPLPQAWAAEAARRAGRDPLAHAAAQYVVRRGREPTLIAGYPWFTDWGRDTFISLRGLMTVEGGAETARRILLSWAGFLSEGMLPNRFPDEGGAPEYTAVDAALWYVVAADALLARLPLAEPQAELIRRTCLGIVAGYAAGTCHGIRVEADGLLAAGEPGLQLTWMDARYRGWVVTPRIGKPVEIQALWLNALRICAAWQPDLRAQWERGRAAFARRFIQPDGSLLDVVDADHVAGREDARCRPNQIFAVGGLPSALLEGAAARAVVDAVERRLLTPLGLRTLAADDPDYRPRYQGDLESRDSAYHQGTVWPWLIGPFVEAWLRTRTAADGDPEALKAEAARRFLDPIMAHRTRVGLGHVTEVADGDAPHVPGGCPFQAWSLFELLRVRDLLGVCEPRAPE